LDLCTPVSFQSRKKGRTKAELDQVIEWLTGYTSEQQEQMIQSKVNFEYFFNMQISIPMHI
jgi:hypothetical protein